LARRFTSKMRAGLCAIMNYVGGAIIYIRTLTANCSELHGGGEIYDSWLPLVPQATLPQKSTQWALTSYVRKRFHVVVCCLRFDI
jgi:hypothetical protein